MNIQSASETLWFKYDRSIHKCVYLLQIVLRTL